MRRAISAAAACLLLTACPGGKGMIRRDAIAPSVEAVTHKFDTLLDLAVQHEDMNAVDYEAWRGESALLRAIVSEDPSQPVSVPE